MALSEAAKEAFYLRRILQELRFPYLNSTPVTLFCDNQGAQELVKNPVYHSRTKHIDIRHHYVRDAYEDGVINPSYITTKEMTADILTKGLNASLHHYMLNKLGVKNIEKFFYLK